MANKKPEQIVDEVEGALSRFEPCPYCGLFDGTHLVTCEFLKHKGNVDAARKGVSAKTGVSSEPKEDLPEKAGEEETKKEDDDASTKKLLDSMKPKK